MVSNMFQSVPHVTMRLLCHAPCFAESYTLSALCSESGLCSTEQCAFLCGTQMVPVSCSLS